MSKVIPSFESLPIDPNGPPYNAWGLYGKEDEFGRLNLIDGDAVKRGKDTITEGKAINLNLPLGIQPAYKKRLRLQHNIVCSGHSNDDEVHFNTQSSSQWDGFRHYPYQNWPKDGEYAFYGGMTLEEASDPTVIRNGVHNFAKKPITSRAHLLDIPLYLSKHSLPSLHKEAFSNANPIPLSTLVACAKESNVELKSGDILVVRTGFTEALFEESFEKRDELASRKVNASIGVEQSEELWKWHWDNGVAAVVTDCPAYEAWPASTPLYAHQIFLGGWGLPIGELFDLRELSKECERLGRWTFFFTSMPLFVEGGIASPPNAQAIL